MASVGLLGIYLNDHRAGASAGSELAKKISAESAGTPHGEFLVELTRDIDQDRVTLEDLMGRLNIDKDPLKEAAGWVFEKLSRLKFSERLTGSSDLKHLLEFESLSLGIEGKLLMWRSLKQMSDRYPELASVDLDGLAKRAESQRAGLEEHRINLAKGALAG